MRALTVAVLLTVGCVTTPEYVHGLVDAPTDSARADAASEAAALVRSGREHLAVRMAAARTLGRLRVADTAVVAALRETLTDPRVQRDLRAYAAWALGELRSAPSLAALTAALRLELEPLVAEHVMEGLTKHYAVMSKDHETLVQIVEGLVFFAGNHRTGALPASYDLLSAHTRTLPVNVEVLDRAIAAAASRPSVGQSAAMYNAAYELMAKLESNHDEIVAGDAAWATRVRAAVDTGVKGVATNDPSTSLLVIWYLGRLSSLPQIARPSTAALSGLANRPTSSEDARLRLVAAWALSRMQVHALGPRRALLMDVVSKELEPSVLEMFGDLSPRKEELDQLQKVLGVSTP